MSKQAEAVNVALDVLTAALKRNDADMIMAASTALDALTRRAAVA